MAASKNQKAIVSDYIFRKMPMPKGATLLGEAGYPGETEKGVAIRRNLIFDVTKRLKEGVCPYPEMREDDLETESYYLKFNDALIEDMWTIISEFCPGVVQKTDLNYERGGDTKIYYSDHCTVVIRARFMSCSDRTTIWLMDIFAQIG